MSQDINKWGKDKSKRNVKCLCGSGIKYKKCCLPKYQGAVQDAFKGIRSKVNMETLAAMRDAIRETAK